MNRLIRCLVPILSTLTLSGLCGVARAERPWQSVSPAPAFAPVARLDDVVAALAIDHDGRLIALTGDTPPDGMPRLFVVAANGPAPIRIQPGTDGASVPHLAALTADDRGRLWALDTSGGAFAELVRLEIDDHRASIAERVPLSSALRPQSRVTALTVRGHEAAIADAGAPAIIMLDLQSRHASRVLENNQSLVPQRPVKVDASVLRGPDDRPVGREDTLIAFSPDGKWLFYQPVSGPLFRVETALLTDPGFSPIEQLEGVAQWRDTPSLGAMAIASDGALFMTDLSNHALLRFSAGRIPQRLSGDPHLSAPRALAVAADGALYVATASPDPAATRKAGRPRWRGPSTILRFAPVAGLARP